MPAGKTNHVNNTNRNVKSEIITDIVSSDIADLGEEKINKSKNKNFSKILPKILPKSKKNTENEDNEDNEDNVNNTEIQNNNSVLSDILNCDDKLLFNLNALGSLQKNEKIAEKGDLLCVDDRWFLQGMRRWWTEDSKVKSTSKTLNVISVTSDRINKLLEDDYSSKLEKEKKNLHKSEKIGLELPEEKRFNESCENRRRLINKYFIAVSKAKSGVENSRDTYSDKFTKNKFNLSIQKADDILNRLQQFKSLEN